MIGYLVHWNTWFHPLLIGILVLVLAWGAWELHRWRSRPYESSPNEDSQSSSAYRSSLPTETGEDSDIQYEVSEWEETHPSRWYEEHLSLPPQPAVKKKEANLWQDSDKPNQNEPK